MLGSNYEKYPGKGTYTFVNTGDQYGIAAGLLISLVMAVFFYRIYKVNVPRFRAPYLALMLVAAGLGITAYMLDAQLMGKIPATFAIGLGLLFPALRLQSKQDKKIPSVAIGDQILNFTALDEMGEPFELASMQGRPFLLKFFRGHW